MKNQEQLLKLEYEHYRTFALAFMAISIAIGWGIISNLEKLATHSFLLFMIILLLIVWVVITTFIYLKTFNFYKELKNIYGN